MWIEPFKLERWMSRWETVVSHDICESGIKPLSIDDFVGLIGGDAGDELRRSLFAMPLGYPEARGTRRLRGLLAETYRGVEADDLLVTTGAIEANFLVFNVLVKPGDHVVAVSPSYQQLSSVPKAIGAEVDLWDLRTDDGGFAFDVDRLEALLRPDTRLIVINTPHNPTGAVLDSDQLDRVIALAAERDAWILSDEAYRWLEFADGAKLVEPARNRYAKAISTGTVSKPFGMPGLRVGWIAANREIVAQCWAFRDYVSLSPVKMSDAVTCALLEHRDVVIRRNQAIMAANLATARAWFSEHADLASWTEPKAALLAMMRYRADIPSLELADRLAADVGVMLAPGSVFGLEHHFRIGIGQDPRIFAEGLERTAAYLAEVTPDLKQR